jgi:hypothetical protein
VEEHPEVVFGAVFTQLGEGYDSCVGHGGIEGTKEEEDVQGRCDHVRPFKNHISHDRYQKILS